MIIAHILHKQTNIPVRVLDAWTSSDGRRLAVVETLDGSRPFTQLTHGGPVDTGAIVIRAEALQGLAVTVEDPALALAWPVDAEV